MVVDEVKDDLKKISDESDVNIEDVVFEFAKNNNMTQDQNKALEMTQRKFKLSDIGKKIQYLKKHSFGTFDDLYELELPEMEYYTGNSVLVTFLLPQFSHFIIPSSSDIILLVRHCKFPYVIYDIILGMFP